MSIVNASKEFNLFSNSCYRAVTLPLVLLLSVALYSSALLAVDCTPNTIFLNSQAQVTDFQTNHGPGCDTVVDQLSINGNDIADLSGLSGLTSIAGKLVIASNDVLTNLNGLSGLISIGDDFAVNENPALLSFHGLSSLTSIGNSLLIDDNDALASLYGLMSLTHIGANDSFGSLTIENNASLASVGGLFSVIYVRWDVQVFNNTSLSTCAGLFRMLNDVDDGQPGPGPGAGGIPDVGNIAFLSGNLSGCNSIAELLPTGSNTSFEVSKDFRGGNHYTPVDVTITCYSGLPLVQTHTITESQGVKFTVGDFEQGYLDCTITEQDLNGYTPTYLAIGPGPGIINSIGGCNFNDVLGGSKNSCHITNDAKPAEVRITKQVVMDGMDGDHVDSSYRLTLYCDAQITKGEKSCNGGLGPYESCLVFEGDESEVFVAQVMPEYPSSYCWVVEQVFSSAVEIENDCDDLVISAGNGASCTITNTVFFEGIPTLNQYGMALLALLMLGLGLVGFRRYA